MSSNDDILGGSSSDGQAIGFKRHLFAPAFIFLVLEIVGIVVPLLGFFGDKVPNHGLLLRIAVPVLIGAQLIWSALHWVWLRPLYRAVVRKRRGERLPEELALAAYRALWKTPLRALAVRTSLWMAVLIALGLFLHKYVGWGTQPVVELTAMGAFHALICNLGRAVWLSYLMERFRVRLFGGVGPLRCFADRYRRAVLLVSMVSIGMTMVAVAAFALFFLPISDEQYLRMQLYFPLAFLLVGAGLQTHLMLASRVLDRYLATQDSSRAQRGDALATDVYRNAQSLPYRLALSFWALWLATAVLAAFLGKARWRLETDDAALMFGTVVVISVGSALYQALWHREIIRPLLDHLTLKHRLPVRGIRTSLSLRTKLLLSFGGMVFFAVGLALFWGFIQYKNLVTKFTASQADLGLAWVRSEVHGAMAASTAPPSAEAINVVIERLSQQGSESSTVYFYLPPGTEGRVLAYGGGPMGTPQLPWYAQAELQLENDARIALRAHSLTGRRGRLVLDWRGGQYDMGAVAVFYPSYRGRGPSLVRPLRELIVFFLVLFGVCGGIVVLTVGQFVKPIRRLEERADGMARGELAQPVSSGGEGDEIGRLTFALEEMRRALREKLRSTEEVNLDLERAVQRRTADLAKKNRELAETLEKLTRAQDQLVQSEKMASIGQLVAGIAHEINNPVNAIVNTVGPLGEAVEELNADSEEVRDEARVDVKDMIRVVQRGADRTKAIVQALHNYSRTDEDSVVGIDLNRSLDDSLELLRHVVFKTSIEIKRCYGDVGRIVGHAGQLNQVFMNLLTNAGQAVGGQ
ncbi:MAG: HAMP domain-containing protein, partial [Myxococcales bacterium]|nr:HAMP domain-containing protein [Myxococcales bacterium]